MRNHIIKSYHSLSASARNWIVFVFTFVLSLVGSLASSSRAEKPADITGIVEIRMVDCFNEDPHHDHDHVEYLLRDEKTRIQTKLQGKPEVLDKLAPHQKVRIVGKRVRGPKYAARAKSPQQIAGQDDGLGLILDGGEVNAEEIEILAENTPEPAAADGEVAEGAPDLKLMSCLLVFASSTTHPCAVTESKALGRLFNNTTNANLGMQAITKGRYGLKLGNGSTKEPIVRLQLNVSSDGKTASEMEQLMDQAMFDLGYATWDYDRVIMFPPGGIESFTAYAYLANPGEFSSGMVSVYGSSYGNDRMNGYLHELGHNFGLGHSSKGSSEYGDRTCVMGLSQSGTQTEPYNVVKLLESNWLIHTPNAHQHVISDVTLNIHPLHLNPTDTNEITAVSMPGDPSYYVAYMRQVLPYSMLTQTGDRDRVFVYSRASTTLAKSFQVANLGPGQSYTFNSHKVTFERYGPNLELATVSIDMNDGNTKPVAIAQTVSTEKDIPVAVTLSGSDVNGDPLTYAVDTPPTKGTLSGTAPNLTYTPNAGYMGSDSFVFSVNDGKISSFATVTITVAAPNFPPVAESQSIEVYFNTPRPVMLTATDGDPDDTLTFRIVSHPSRGSLSGSLPNLIYTPNLNATGSDSFTFQASDGKDESNVATISLVISGVANTAPEVDAGEDKATSIAALFVPWSPSDLALDRWYDASDTETIQSNEGKVVTWSDKSGNGQHATTSNPPGTNTRQINNLNALDFVVGNRLAIPSIDMANKAMFAVLSRERNAISQILSHSSTNVQLRFESNGTLRYAASSDRYSGSRASIGAIPLNTPGMVGFLVGPTLEFSVNGAFDPTTSVAGSGSSIFNQIGLRSSSNDPFAGLIGEILLTHAIPDAGTREKIEGYLAHKWGLTANLPAGHPYKSAVPTQTSSGVVVFLSDANANDSDELSILWTVVSKPGGPNVTFEDATSVNTSATFYTPGTYVLRLSASDGMATSSDDITILVSDDSAPAYMVKYDGNGHTAGTEPLSQSKVHDVQLTLSANSGNLVKSGFRFVGWNTAANGSGVNYAAGGTYSPNQSTTLYAKWETAATTYPLTVTNGSGSGSYPPGTIVPIVATIPAGSQFSTWTGATSHIANLTQASTTVTMPTASITVTAQLSPTSYTVSYQGNGSTGGTPPASQLKNHGATLTLAGAGSLVRTGYLFAGWNTAANGSGLDYAAGAAYATNADMVLYARWMPNNCIVTFHANGGDAPSIPSKPVTFHAAYGTLPTVNRTGHTFAGWFTAVTGGTQVTAASTVNTATNHILYARWTALTYTVTYQGNGSTSGTAPATQNKSFNVPLTLASQGTLLRTGHDFLGWNTVADGSGVFYAAGSSYTANAPLALHAQWAETPKLTLELAATSISEDGGSTSVRISRNTPPTTELIVQLSVSLSGKVSLPSTVTIPVGKTSASFVVAALNDGTTGTKNVTLTASASGFTSGTAALDVTDIAAARLKIVLNPSTIAENGGTVSGTVTRTGIGGNSTVQLRSSNTAKATVPTSVSLNGSATSASFNVTIVDNAISDGNELVTITGTTSGGAPAASVLTVTDNEAATYVVAYNANGASSGSAPAIQTKAHGANLTLATNSGSLAKTGFSFAGWNTTADGTGTNYTPGAAYSANASLVLYAKWVALGTHSLTVDGGTGGGSYTMGAMVPISATVPTGSRFVNWTGGTAHLANVNSASTTLTMPAAAVTITANFVANQTPVANSQSVTTLLGTAVPITLTASDADLDPLAFSIVSMPANGTLHGTPPNLIYSPSPGFSGINTFSFRVNDGIANSPTATVTITVTAPVTYTLTVNGGDGTGSYPAGATVFLSATVPPNARFINWTGDISYLADPNSASTTLTMPESNITVTAVSVVDNPPVVFAGADKSAFIAELFVPWSPSQLALDRWYDASDTGTIQSDEGKVVSWSDKSGNGQHATSSNQPATNTRQINNLNALDFVVGNRLAIPSIDMANKAMFAVVSRERNAISQIFSHSTTNVQLRFESSGTLRYAAASDRYAGSRASTGSIPLNTPGMVGFLLGPTLEFSVNGAFDPTTSAAVSGSSTFNQIGLRGSSSDPFAGLIGEILVTHAIPDAGARGKIEGYLAWKWGLQGELPTTHPHKLERPLAPGAGVQVFLSDANVNSDILFASLWTVTSKPDGGTVTFEDDAAINTTATFDTPGTYLLRLTATNDAGSSFDEISVTVTAPGGSPYGVWTLNYPDVNLSDPDADADGDGISNHKEFLFGLNPTDSKSNNPVSLPLSAQTGTMRYTRTNPALSGAVYTVWYSSDLATWHNDTGAVQQASAPDGKGVQTVEVTISQALLNNPKLFIRIQAQ